MNNMTYAIVDEYGDVEGVFSSKGLAHQYLIKTYPYKKAKGKDEYVDPAKAHVMDRYRKVVKIRG